MKIIHTADWHLGQTFFGYDRIEEHLKFFEWLKHLVKDRNADLLLVSGDIYDTQNPSAESQQLFYRFVKEINEQNPGLQVIIIAGNHDSGARLEAPNPLLDLYNVQVRGLVHKEGDDIDYNRLIIPVKERAGSVAAYCLAVPYLRQGDFPKSESYSKGVGALYAKLYETALELTGEHGSRNDATGSSVPIIAMGHLYASGASVLDDDRTEGIIVGGLDAVDSTVFPAGVDYVALGHLHKAQKLGGNERIRYSGAPLPMSFAERNYRQGAVLVEICPNGKKKADVAVEQLVYDSPVELLRIPKDSPGNIEEILHDISLLPDKFFGERDPFAPFVEVRMRYCEPDPAIMPAIERALESKNVRLARIVQMQPGNQPEESDVATVLTVDDLNSIKPLEMMKRIYGRCSGGAEMDKNLEKLLCSVMEEVEKEEGEL